MQPFASALLLGIVGAVTSPLASQCYFMPSDTPNAGTCNVIPFGTNKTSATWVNQRYQSYFTPAELGGKPQLICSLAFAACNVQTRGFDSLVVTMAQTSSTLSTSFTANLATNPIVVLTAKDYVWPTTPNAWTNIGLQRAYPFDPTKGNLVIDIVAMGNDRLTGNGTGFHRQSGRQRIYAFTWTGMPPATGRTDTAALKMRVCSGVADTTLLGKGCGRGSTALQLAFSGAPKLGQTLNMDLSYDSAFTGVGFALLGVKTVSVDLKNFGAPTCFWYVDPVLALPAAIANGKGSVKLPIPNNQAFLCGILFAQGLALDARANALGYAFGNYGRFVVGR